MTLSKPDQIKWLEKKIGVPLHPLLSGKLADYQNRTCYELDATGQICGLNLALCRITDGSFLMEMNQLTSLNLGFNKVTDWSFLGRMKLLTNLDLSSNSITDWSFLEEMNLLTDLRLSSNNITNGSFLNGMNQLDTLDLSSNLITDWSFLNSMKKLNNLYLSFNNISDGSFLDRMNQLKTLDLSSNFITNWTFLNRMKNVNSLHLSSNSITDGSFLNHMNHLETLDLSSNIIADWSFLKGMSQLTSIDLSSNNITNASFLKGMNHLDALDLSSNVITDWSFLKEMDQLTSLNLSKNMTFTDWSFLYEMNNLINLNLSSSYINKWSFLKCMPNLKFLDIENNNISDGSFLQNVHGLTSLNIRRNHLTEYSFVENMKNLSSLNISSNKITTITSALIDTDLEIISDRSINTPYSINVFDNPFKDPPLEIIEQTHASILEWFYASQEGEIDINEVKIILVGDGGSGKTTVRKRLMRLPGDPKESQTHGIEIHDHEIPYEGRSILAHFWDFGGQEIMHATHQFFLSRRSLYILLLDGRKEEDAEYWLKHIESFGGNSPIVICLNKIDQNSSFEVDRKKLIERHPRILDFYRLKCLDENDAEVNRLLAEIPKHIAKVEMSQSKWPWKWAKVKDRLLKDKRPYLDQNEFTQICTEEKILKEGQRHTLIRFLNDLGIALHFDDRRLSLLQILTRPRPQPQEGLNKKGVLLSDGSYHTATGAKRHEPLLRTIHEEHCIDAMLF